MPRLISSTEFRRRMIRILDEVERGKQFTLTYYGKVLAHIIPHRHHKTTNKSSHPRLDTSYTKN